MNELNLIEELLITELEQRVEFSCGIGDVGCDSGLAECRAE